MKVFHQGYSSRGNTCALSMIMLLTVILFTTCASSALALDPFPAAIKNIKMGDSMAAVTQMIAESGKHEVEPATPIRRASVVWDLPRSPYYRKLTFRFTEKDRLYLIRFDLKNIPRRELRALKDPLFEKYGISWDNPWRLKVKDNDILLYGPPTMGDVYYFEFSNRKTGEKAMELLSRITSAEDRPAKSTEKTEKTEKPEAGGTEDKTPPQAAGKPPAEKKKELSEGGATEKAAAPEPNKKSKDQATK